MVTQATGTGRRDPDQESLETHFSMTGTQCTNRIWPKGYCPTQVLRGKIDATSLGHVSLALL